MSQTGFRTQRSLLVNVENESTDGREILLGTNRIRLHGLFARSPVGGADLIRVGLNVLEGLKNTQGFVNVPANRQVVDGGVHDHTIRIDDEQATQSHAFRIIKNVVSGCDFFFQVGNQGIGDVAKTTLIAWGLDPGEVAELAVDRHAENFSVLAGEIGVAIAERGDFSGADEREVEGIEEQHHVLTAVLGQGDVLEFLIHHGSGCEVRGLLANAKAAVRCHVRDVMKING